jgi:mannose-6-phosphate isomerase
MFFNHRLGGVLLFKITNVARDYAWGSKTLIAEYFQIAPTGRPMAEIWFGTHAGSPAKTESGSTLRESIGHDLSFLLKILAAETPLSIQAHPNSKQAFEGFARENAAGIDLHSPIRNYKDEHHKPEMLVALSEFQALCGFKSVAAIDAMLADFAEIPSLSEAFKSTASTWRALLADSGLAALVADVLSRRDNFLGFTSELASLAEFEGQYELAAKLNQLYAGDPGVFIAMLMNHVWLEPGQAIFLGAGEIHAYLSGLGVEIMAASDNVLRGGLTEKHIDVDELVSILNFEPTVAAVVMPVQVMHGVYKYDAPVADFALLRVDVDGEIKLSHDQLPAESIALVTEGSISMLADNETELTLSSGEAAYVDDSGELKLVGSGTVFIGVGARVS